VENGSGTLPAGAAFTRYARSDIARWQEARMATKENDRIVETATEARAGATGQNVRYVLGWATAGVIALFVIVYLFYFV